MLAKFVAVYATCVLRRITMGILVSNILATGAWMAFLSILAIIGIVVAGGFIVALLGKMVITLVPTYRITIGLNETMLVT